MYFNKINKKFKMSKNNSEVVDILDKYEINAKETYNSVLISDILDQIGRYQLTLEMFWC